MKLSEILNQLGETRENYFGAVAPPIIQTSNFAFKDVAGLRQAIESKEQIPLYSRGQNPTLVMLNQKLAALEGAEAALSFASGTAAMGAAILQCVQAGDHIILVEHAYVWTRYQVTEWLAKFGVESTIVDGRELANFEAARKPNTKLAILESPNSINLELQDVPAVAQWAQQHHITTIIDNTYASQMNPSPLEMGIDIVVYSGSKYHSGHSDVVFGAVCGSQAFISSLYSHEFLGMGGIISPMNAWLIIRSLRTLPIRIAHISQSTVRMVEALAAHPKIRRIIYPHHPSHPQYTLAKQQMPTPTGLFSIELDTDDAAAVERCVNQLKHHLIAVSWGGHESVVLPVIGVMSEHEANGQRKPTGLVRISVGLEAPEVLIADWEQALTHL